MDGFGKVLWQGQYALAAVGTCGGYETHYYPAPDIDWSQAEVMTATLSGAKTAGCGGSGIIPRVSKEIIAQCQQRYGTSDVYECGVKAYSSYSSGQGQGGGGGKQ